MQLPKPPALLRHLLQHRTTSIGSALGMIGAIALGTPAPVLAQTFICDGTFYLAQNSPSDYFTVNTATNSLDFQFNPGVYTNAIGFNVQDGFMYGIHAGNGTVYRIKSDGTFDDLGNPPNAPRSFAGDVDGNGTYYILNTSDNPDRRKRLYRINVTGLATATDVPGFITLSRAVSVADFAFNPIDGKIYGLEGRNVVQIDPVTGTVVNFTTVSTPSISGAGATYFDGFGNFYAYNNGSGNLVKFILDLGAQSATGALFATGGRVSLNDGAACPFQPRIEKTVTPSPIRAGDPVTYTYRIANSNPFPINGVTIADTLPAGDGRTYIANSLNVITPGVGGTLNAYAGTKNLTITNATFPAQTEILLSIGVDIPVSTPAGTVQNQARIENIPVGFGGPIITSDFPPTGTPQDETPLVILPPFADLSLNKTVDNPIAGNGDTITYTVTLNNTGPGNATGVTVTDQLPAGTTFISANPSQGSYDNTTGLWTVGTVVNGSLATLEITALVTTPDPVTNTAQVSGSDQPDPDSDPNNGDPDEDDQASVTTPAPSADLALVKQLLTPAPINLNDTVTFRLTLNNNGPNQASNVDVTDQLPPGLTFVSATPSQGSYVSNTGLWSVGNLANGGSATLDIEAMVTTTGGINNIAIISDLDEVDPNPSNDQDDDNVPAQQADLSLIKTASSNTPNLGDDVTFTLTLANNGPNTATNVAVTDQLPAGLTFVSATPSQGFYNSGTGLWTVGTVTNGANATLELIATVTTTDTVTNQAQISNSDQTDPNPGNDSDDESVDGQQADLSLTKTATPPDATNGDRLTYTITITNDGPDAATGVTVFEQLPATGLTNISSTPSQGTFPATPDIWNVGTIPAGGSATLTIVADVTTFDPIVNVARIDGSDQPDPDSNPGNDDLAEDDQDGVVTPAQQADLELTKTVDNPTPNVGDNVTFTLTLLNNSAGLPNGVTPVAATNVQVTDQLPAGLNFASAIASQGTYDPISGIWNVSTVPLDQPVTLQIVAAVADTTTVTNTAAVTDSDQTDPDPNDNQDSEPVTGQLADLEILKTVDNANPELGDTVNYTITLTNNGPSNATGIQVSEPAPVGLTNVAISVSSGSYDPATGLWNIPSLNNGQTATLQMSGTVDTVVAITNVAQIVASDQPDPDSDPNDDSEEDDIGRQTLGQRSDPNLRLVKRITEIEGINGTTLFSNFVNDSNNANLLDQAGFTPVGAPQVATNPPTQSGDIIEYGIYFLSDGNVPASPALLCDLIPANSQFQPNSYGSGQGVQVQLAGAPTPTPQSNVADADGVTFYPPLSPLPTGNPCLDPNNPNGAVMIDLGAVPSTPGSNFGLVRFKVRLN